MGIIKKPLVKRLVKSTGRSGASTNVSLSTERSKPANRVEDITAWFYGVPGVGKTTLSGEFERCHHFMFEAGAKFLTVHQKTVKTWPEMRRYVELMEASDSFDTATVDVVERAYEMCFNCKCKEMGIEHPGDEKDMGKSWGIIRQEFMGQLNRLMRAKAVVFVSHATEKEIKSAIREEYTTIAPNLSGKPLLELHGAVDLMGYMSHDGAGVVMQIRPDDLVMAKCRPPDKFFSPKGDSLLKIPLGSSAQEAYANYSAAFRNELKVDDRYLVGYRVPKSAVVPRKKLK